MYNNYKMLQSMMLVVTIAPHGAEAAEITPFAVTAGVSAAAGAVGLRTGVAIGARKGWYVASAPEKNNRQATNKPPQEERKISNPWHVDAVAQTRDDVSAARARETRDMIWGFHPVSPQELANNIKTSQQNGKNKSKNGSIKSYDQARFTLIRHILTDEDGTVLRALQGESGRAGDDMSLSDSKELPRSPSFDEALNALQLGQYASGDSAIERLSQRKNDLQKEVNELEKIKKSLNDNIAASRKRLELQEQSSTQAQEGKEQPKRGRRTQARASVVKQQEMRDEVERDKERSSNVRPKVTFAEPSAAAAIPGDAELAHLF